MKGSRPVLVPFLAVAVRVARHIQPMARPAFAVMRAGQEVVNQGCRISFCRRQADQVIADAPSQRARRSHRAWFQSFGLQCRQNKLIGRGSNPPRVIDSWRRDISQRTERPMIAIGGLDARSEQDHQPKTRHNRLYFRRRGGSRNLFWRNLPELDGMRSEERRVGKESRSWWWT